MRIRVYCPNCGVAFTAAERHAGKVGRCPGPNCGRKLRVPEARPDVVFDSIPSQRSARKRSAAPSPARSRAWGTVGAGLAVAAALVAGLILFLPAGDEPAVAATPDLSDERLAARPASPDDATAAPATPAPQVKLAAMVEPKQNFAEGVGGFLKTHCLDCHGPDYAEADVDFGSVASADDVRENREEWERILAILKVGAMPPSEMEQPSAEERAAAVDWIDRVLHEVDCQVDNDPGRVTVRRLNRTEYDNTVRDLLGVDLNLSEHFPTDDVGNGFDNQGDVLTLPPLLLEKYLAAAETIAEEAIVGDVSTLMNQGEKLDAGRSVQGHKGTYRFPAAGDYTIRIHAQAHQAGPDKAKYQATLAGLPLAEVTLKKERTTETFERTIPVKQGEYPLEIKFVNDYYQDDGKGGKLDRNIYLEEIEIHGPLGQRPENLPPIHAAIVTTTPDEAGGVREAAEEIFRPLATRAFRRPATDLEVQRLATLVESVVSNGRTFEQGVQLGLQAVLCSPHFLFRIERDPADARPGEPAALNDYELASRLSYFLWSSMPDEELLRLAGEGRLTDPKTLSEQVDRMLEDPKSEALVEGFFAQWLNLGMLDEFNPDGRQFGEMWTSDTKNAMRRETELFCREVLEENLPVKRMLDADFTFVNPRLAEFYGIPWDGRTGEKMEEYYADGLPDDVKKDGRRFERERRRRIFPYPDEAEFRRVSLPENRRGLLTHGSILALTSNPVATSPVKRGKWILDNILGTPPPPAPPNVPALEETQESNKDLSLREALAKHREDPGCASCHAVMDPLGFAFERFDAVGRWREKDGKHEIDASGELPDGTKFTGATELIDVLAGRSDEFVAHFTRQLMTYGLGRGLLWYDRCSVDGIVESARPEGHRLRDLIRGVVLSDPFRKRTTAALAAN
ncbi:DUF1592 domain-containing protein [Alienimonas californiensis]|uniref:DUF1592 domain-containing protein n=1 Tax=Alienimonas californiensis TaxID=2527989 RepID=A0A517PE45_9PLAN|nr:DUF1592 domain-containing protein [Alienimonas californiensis]QDT17655.1 hypothetical protein CA12_37850 [Alienimonas californiensis]